MAGTISSDQYPVPDRKRPATSNILGLSRGKNSALQSLLKRIHGKLPYSLKCHKELPGRKAVKTSMRATNILFTGMYPAPPPTLGDDLPNFQGGVHPPRRAFAASLLAEECWSLASITRASLLLTSKHKL